MDTFLTELSQNIVLWTAIGSWFIAQLFKFILDFAENKRPSLYILLLSTGGMPSSHSSFVVSAATIIGCKDGWGSSGFAIAFVISMVIMADAAGVRRAAGKQAAVLNMLIEKLNNPNISIDEKLRELLGHTPFEVAAGALLGIICGFISGWMNGLL